MGNNRQYKCSGSTMYVTEYSGDQCTGEITVNDRTVPTGKCTYWNSEAYAMIQCKTSQLGNSTEEEFDGNSTEEEFDGNSTDENTTVGTDDQFNALEARKDDVIDDVIDVIDVDLKVMTSFSNVSTTLQSCPSMA